MVFIRYKSVSHESIFKQLFGSLFCNKKNKEVLTIFSKDFSNCIIRPLTLFHMGLF